MLPAGVDTFHIWRNLCLILKTSAAWSYIHGKKAHCDGYFFWPHLVVHILTCPKNVCHPSKEQYWFSNTAEGQDRCRDLQHFLRQSQSAWHDPCAKRHEHRTCNHTWKNKYKVWITISVWRMAHLCFRENNVWAKKKARLLRFIHNFCPIFCSMNVGKIMRKRFF